LSDSKGARVKESFKVRRIELIHCFASIFCQDALAEETYNRTVRTDFEALCPVAFKK
jgi:hypothetical protein